MTVKNALNIEETLQHLGITMSGLQSLIKSHLIIVVSDEHDDIYFPMFQFNGNALNLRMISVFQQFKKNEINSEIIAEWFLEYNETLNNTPVDYVREFGADEKIMMVANLASDIFLL